MFNSPITTNIATTDLTKAKKFYTETLGLKVTQDWGQALRLDAGGAPLFIYQREKPPQADHTVASWDVPDVRQYVKSLSNKGIKFEMYEGMDQDAAGIASWGDDGPKTAWFKDPDGNILGLMQPAIGK